MSSDPTALNTHLHPALGEFIQKNSRQQRGLPLSSHVRGALPWRGLTLTREGPDLGGGGALTIRKPPPHVTAKSQELGQTQLSSSERLE